MRNTVIDYLRRRYMKKDKMDIYTCCEEEGRSTVEEDYYYKELRVAHRKMVKQLSEKRRQAYILYFYRGMSYAPLPTGSVCPNVLWAVICKGRSGRCVWGWTGYTGIRRGEWNRKSLLDNMCTLSAFRHANGKGKGFFPLAGVVSKA